MSVFAVLRAWQGSIVVRPEEEYRGDLWLLSTDNWMLNATSRVRSGVIRIFEGMIGAKQGNGDVAGNLGLALSPSLGP
jgi:hypothetical protein